MSALRQGKKSATHTKTSKAHSGEFRKGVTLSEREQRKLILAAALGKELRRKKKSGEEALLKGSNDHTIYMGAVVKMESYDHIRIIRFRLYGSYLVQVPSIKSCFSWLTTILLNLAFIKTYSKS